MATWGGSTADNLESIEENHSNAGQEADQQHVSDGKDVTIKGKGGGGVRGNVGTSLMYMIIACELSHCF